MPLYSLQAKRPKWTLRNLKVITQRSYISDEKEMSSGRRKPVGLGKMVTWIRYSTQGGDPQDVRFHPNNPDVVYGCSAHGSVCGFSVSTRKVIEKQFYPSCVSYSLHWRLGVSRCNLHWYLWDKLKLQPLSNRWSTWPTMIMLLFGQWEMILIFLFISIYSLTYWRREGKPGSLEEKPYGIRGRTNTKLNSQMTLYYTVKEGVPLTCAPNPRLLFAKNLFVGFYKVFN